MVISCINKRVLAAQQIILAKNADTTQAAYQAAYESTLQFSRGDARMFGTPPVRDIERLHIVL